MGQVVHVIKKLDLAAIMERTDIPVRTLRYVIDHNLVIGLRVEQSGRGNARFLTLFDATVLCAAATLLEAGYTQASVKEMISQYRGAKRTRQVGSFWRGRQCGQCAWYFATTFVRVSLDISGIESLLKGDL